MRLKDKVAVITGAGSGIGRKTAILFAEHGAKVTAADVNLETAEETCSMIKEQGGQCIAVKTDVSNARDIQEMLNTTLNAFGKLDILYNNAGIPMIAQSIEDVTEELFDRIMDVNVKGVFLGCKYAVPIFKMQGTGGVIISTASSAVSRPRPGQNIYAASKGTIVTLTRALAAELAEHQIRVAAINPVAVDTPMFYGFIGDRDEQEARASFKSTIPLGRMAQPEDIAYAALYLASDEASLVTGAIMDVDGGRGV
ncbi:glucose 1-dehydrogenase [Ferviditalea candida]|uniref:Glucose 1-dehydrogenase n=1 Tax=Ferviditalea candida TaxID=3108399 RepID=A0ABU5ZH60_9BACL|nr:glucose 1-dehydrogenase [Paenibacillaceae bacterium T2]